MTRLFATRTNDMTHITNSGIVSTSTSDATTLTVTSSVTVTIAISNAISPLEELTLLGVTSIKHSVLVLALFSCHFRHCRHSTITLTNTLYSVITTTMTSTSTCISTSTTWFICPFEESTPFLPIYGIYDMI